MANQNGKALGAERQLNSLKLDALRLESLKTVHIVGVGGTLMGAFAAFLKRRGVEVTGSDLTIYPPMCDVLREAGVQVMIGYRVENLTKLKQRPDLVVIGNVIRSDNLEARAAIDAGYLYSSLPEAMEKLFLPLTRNLVVAGTHGKTTTSSLLAYTLIQCGQEPNYFIGGVSKDLPFSFNLSNVEKGRPFVLEGDEYDTAFWDKVPKFNHYLPDDAILTSVEYDHADIYPDFDSVKRAFHGLLSRIRPGGCLIACFDSAEIREMSLLAKVPVLSYGSSPKTGSRYFPAQVRVEEAATSFQIFEGQKCVAELEIQLPGMHNVLNAMAVWIQCQKLGLDPVRVKTAFKSFQGVRRRQEVRAEIGGVLVMDDFAHHPTAVRETLRALKLKYSKRRLVAVFEPRSATSRRKVFQQDYLRAFQEADVIFIAVPFDQTQIPSQDQFSSEVLVEELKKLGKDARVMGTVEAGVLSVAEYAREGDLVAVLSNGGFGGFIPKLLEVLPKG